MVIYLCSAEGKKAGRQEQFVPSASFCSTVFTAEMGARSLPVLSSPSQRNNSRKRLFGPDVGASAGLYLPALAGMA